MSVYGNVILKVNDKLKEQLKECEDLINAELIVALLEGAEVDFSKHNLSKTEKNFLDFDCQPCFLSPLDDHYLELGVSEKEGYIYFSVSGELEWIGLLYVLTMTSQNIELYSFLHDEYGGNTYFARNAKGEKFAYWWEEDSDETFQDDFNEEEYENNLANRNARWKSIIPKKIKSEFSRELHLS